jgi:hypothetical protein
MIAAMDRVAGPSTEHLPGAEIFRAGISDLLAQRETAAAALVHSRSSSRARPGR